MKSKIIELFVFIGIFIFIFLGAALAIVSLGYTLYQFGLFLKTLNLMYLFRGIIIGVVTLGIVCGVWCFMDNSN